MKTFPTLPKFLSAPAFLSTALLLTAALPAVADCDHSAKRNLSENLDGISRVEIEARAGDLEIRAASGDTLQADGKACASSKSLLQNIKLTAKRSGGTLYIRAETPDSKGWTSYSSLDLEINVPADIALRVDDSSGDLNARGVTLERLTDGSGDIRLSDTHGATEISDGSGDLVVRSHQGDIEVADGSGDVRLRDITGAVLIRSDGSGDLSMTRVSGDVEVSDDGSGDIVAENIGGDLRVGSAGSGDVRYSDVSGRVDVPSRR